jgi:hypothetical protein
MPEFHIGHEPFRGKTWYEFVTPVFDINIAEF